MCFRGFVIFEGEKLSAEPVYDTKTETYAYKAEEVPEEERLTEEKYRAVYPKGEEEEDEDGGGDDEVEPDPADPIGPTPIDPWPVYPAFGNTMVKEKYAIFGIVRGYKQYELSNHLGNVLTTLSDKKGYNLQSDYYLAEILSAQDYYPGGMLQPGRQYNPDSYRFGAGTQEMVNEIKGVGNHYTAPYWEMDPRLNRRWNTDPIVKFHESPYATFANNPIWFVDHNGADTTFFQPDGSYDKQAKKDFMNAFNNVKSKINDLNNTISEKQKELNTNGLSDRKKGKINNELETLKNNLSNIQKLKDDFDNIINDKNILFRYTSNTDGLAAIEFGLTTGSTSTQEGIRSGVVKIQIRPNRDDAVIHENRHGNQILDGSFTKPLLDRERDAFIYQRIYNPRSVSDAIKRAQEAKYGKEGASMRPDWSLDQMIEFLYPIND